MRAVWVAGWTALFDGSSLICGYIGGWIAGGLVLRLGALVVVAGFAYGLPYTQALMWVAGGTWVLGALFVGLRDAAAKAKGEQSEQPAGPAPLSRDELAAAMHQIGAPHAHLSALATHLSSTPERVRAGCAAASIPIEGGVRMKGRGVSTGVKADHYPPLPSPTGGHPALVVVAGQPDNNNGNNGLEVEQRQGMTIIRNLRERHRAHRVQRTN